MIEYTAANSPLPRPIEATDVGHTAAFLCQPARRGDHRHAWCTWTTAIHAMGMAVVGDGG